MLNYEVVIKYDVLMLVSHATYLLDGKAELYKSILITIYMVSFCWGKQTNNKVF